MYRIVRLVALLVMVIGGLMCWPFARAHIEYQRAAAQVLSVVLEPVGNDQQRVSVCYEFLHGDTYYLAWGQGSPFYRQIAPAEEPVLPTTQAEALARRLRGFDDSEGRPRMLPVFYLANDPEGSAFIMAVDHDRPWQRTVIGVILAIVGLSFLTARKPEA